MNWTRKAKQVCPGCGKKFRTAQGLGLHFMWARKWPAVCKSTKAEKMECLCREPAVWGSHPDKSCKTCGGTGYVMVGADEAPAHREALREKYKRWQDPFL